MAGIYNLEQLRSTAPKNLQGVSDEQLILEYSNSTGQDPFYVADLLGIQTGQDRSAFGAGISAGVDSLQGLGISAAAGAADLFGADETAASLREAAEGQQYQAYFAGRPELERVEDQTLESALPYFGYQLGRQVPLFAGIAAAQFIPGLGQAASATGLARLGAMAPRAMGGGNVSRAAMSRVGPMTAAEVAGVQQGAALAKSTMVGTGLGFGSLYESSAADGDPDPWKALALSPLYGVAEAAVPAAITGAFRLKTGGYTGGLASRMAKGGAVAGIGETGTELFQTELELGLDPTLTSEERASARLNAAVAGGLVGGTFGTATGFKAGPQIRENEVGETDMAPSTAQEYTPSPTQQNELDLGNTLFGQEYDETGVAQTRPLPTEPAYPTRDVGESDESYQARIAEAQEETADFAPLPYPVRYADDTDASYSERVAEFEAQGGSMATQQEAAEGQMELVLPEQPDERVKFTEKLQAQAKGRPIPKGRRAIIDRQIEKFRKDLAAFEKAAKTGNERAREIAKNAATRVRGQLAALEAQVNKDDARTQSISKLATLEAASQKIETTAGGKATVKDGQELTTEELAVLQEGTPNIYRQVAPAGSIAETVGVTEQAATADTTRTPEQELAAAGAQQEREKANFEDIGITEAELSELEREISEINASSSKLSAAVKGEKAEAKGPVTLSSQVLQGIARMVLSPDVTPTGFVYKLRTAIIDQEATAVNLKRMREIHNAVMSVLAASAKYNNIAANIVKNQKDEENDGKRLSVARREKRARLKTAAQQVQNSMEQLVAAAGSEKNAQAVIAAVKIRRQKGKPSTKFEAGRFSRANALLRKTGNPIKSVADYSEIVDTLLSSSFQRFLADGVTDETYIRPTDSRNLGNKGLSPIVKAYNEGGLNGILMQVGSYLGTTSAYGTVLGTSLRQAIRKLDAELAIDGKRINVEFYGVDEKGTAFYDPATYTIKLNQNASQEEVMHETLHAALQAFVYQNPNAAEVVALERALEDLFDYMDNNDLSNVPQKEMVEAVTAKLRELYDAGNKTDAILELISYGSTLNDFRTVLKTIPTSTKNATAGFSSALSNVIGKVLQVIREFLGVNDTVANVVLEGSISLLARAANSRVNLRTPYGGRLYMAVNSGRMDDMNPVGANNTVLAEAVRGASREKRETLSLVTRPFFEMIGWAKGVDKLSDIAEQIKDKIVAEFPKAEMTLKWFNASFGLSENLVEANKRFSETQSQVSVLAEAISDYFNKEASAKQQKAILSYLDGDKKALDGKDLRATKAIAESLEKAYNTMVSNLTDPVAIEHFAGKSFTEALIFPDSKNTIASSSFSMAKLPDMVKKIGLPVTSTELDQMQLDNFVPEDENGNPDLSGTFYQITYADEAGNKIKSFIGASKFDNNADLVKDTNMVVDTSREWKLFRNPGATNYRAVSKINYAEASEIANARRVGIAISNTMHALAGNIAAANWVNTISNSPDTSFNNVEELNAYLNADVENEDDQKLIDPNKIIDVADALENVTIRNNVSVTGTYVRLGDTATYGALAGKILPGPVWKSLYDASNRESLFSSVPLWDTANRRFKKSKTVYNPGTQITNVASNVTFLITNDIPVSMLPRAAKMLAMFETNSDKLSDQDIAIMQAFYESGAMIGSFSQAEIKQELYDEVAKNAAIKKGDSIIDTVAGMLNIQSFTAEYIEKAVQKGSEIDDVATQLYAAGDNMFRLAAFIKSLDNQMSSGNTDQISDEMVSNAGRFARDAFLDYNIDAPFLKIARSSFMPFLSWTYAAIPRVARTIATKPWKLANIAIAYSLLDTVAASLAGDDEEKRRLGPEYLQDRVFGFGPRVYIRIPFMGDEDNPVYYKLGDYLPLQSTFSPSMQPFAGLDWIPMGFTPGGPFIAALTAVMTGEDPVSGKELHRLEDGDFQRIFNIGRVITDQFLPSALGSTSRGKYEDVLLGNKSYAGLEPDVMYTVISRLVGLKTTQFNVDEQMQFKGFDASKLNREYSAAISKLKREELRKGTPDYEALNETILDLRTEMLERLNEIYGVDEE